MFETLDDSIGVFKEQNVWSDVFEQYNLCVTFFVGKFVRETCYTFANKEKKLSSDVFEQYKY